MQTADFIEFRDSLIDSGIRRNVADRMAQELLEHFEDLMETQRLQGYSESEARSLAGEELGALTNIREATLGTSALRRSGLSVALAGAAGTASQALGNGSQWIFGGPYARWMAGILFGAMVTAAMLLSMQLAIIFS